MTESIRTIKGEYKYSHTNRHGIKMYIVEHGIMSEELIIKRDMGTKNHLIVQEKDNGQEQKRQKEKTSKTKTNKKSTKKEITGILTHIDSECQESIGYN